MIIKSVIKKYIRNIKRSKGKINNHAFPMRSIDENGIIIINHEGIYGGAPLLGNYIFEYLESLNFDIDLIYLNDGPLCKKYIDRENFQLITNKTDFQYVIKELKKLGYKKILINSVCSAEFLIGCELSEFRIVSLIHELPNAIKILARESEANFIATQSNCIIFPSVFVKQKFISKFPVYCRSSIKHQGMYLFDCKKVFTYEDKKESKLKVQDKYKVPSTKQLILSVAGSSKRKGFDYFVKLSKTMPDCFFVWIGFNCNDKFSLKYSNGLSDNILLLPYIQDIEILNTFYSAADCFFLSSREEPFGSVVLESFLNFTPVVAFSNCGGYVDVVRDGITGFLVHKGDLKKVKIAVRKCFDNKEMCINSHNYALASNFEDYCQYILQCFTKGN